MTYATTVIWQQSNFHQQTSVLCGTGQGEGSVGRPSCVHIVRAHVRGMLSSLSHYEQQLSCLESEQML